MKVQEGWREAPGWFQSENLLYWGFAGKTQLLDMR